MLALTKKIENWLITMLIMNLLLYNVSFMFYIISIRQDALKRISSNSQQHSWIKISFCLFLKGCCVKITNSRDLDCQWQIWGKWLLLRNCFYGRARVPHLRQIIFWREDENPHKSQQLYWLSRMIRVTRRDLDSKHHQLLKMSEHVALNQHHIFRSKNTSRDLLIPR